MTKAEDLLARIETECIKYKGLYTWLDEVIEDIIQNAKDLLNNFPSDDILDKMEVDFVCEDHHDGYIHEVFVSYVDPEKKGLSFRIGDRVFDIINNDGDVCELWDLDSDKSIKVIASELYSELKKQLVY